MDDRMDERAGRSAHRPRHAMPLVEETSAGGLVIQVSEGAAQVALIARHNRAGRLEWCLPKGHPEAGESLQDAAVREVAEETGIQGRPLRSLGSVDYWFSAEGRRIHKVVHHFLLEAVGGTISVEGDPDREAVDAEWVPLEELQHRLTFANERRLARDVSQLLSDKE
jgi:8-oxo-dGTP pyrophosphatase MutT (NUDIX family)